MAKVTRTNDTIINKGDWSNYDIDSDGAAFLYYMGFVYNLLLFPVIKDF